MLRKQQDEWQETSQVSALLSEAGPLRLAAMSTLIEFLEAFDYFLFLYDPVYRRQLDGLLDQLNEEEFETFERTYAQRLPMN